MENDPVFKHFTKYADISLAEFNDFLKFGITRYIKKNAYLLEQGKEKSNVYFVKSGCLVTYHEDNYQFNHVLQFSMDTWWTGDLESATRNDSFSNYTIKALADCVIIDFAYTDLEHLIEEMPKFQKYFRYLFQNALSSQQRRIVENISLTAEERYESFLKIYPKSELIIPQKYIASYVGITPEFMSKMKAKIYAKAY